MPCAMPYWKAVAVSFDQFCNALLKGWPDETFSSRCWRWHQNGKRSWPCKTVDAIFFFDRDNKTGKRHCQMSFDTEREGRQHPPEARAKLTE